MGEGFIISSYDCCGYQSNRRDCDGDYETYCTKYGECEYQYFTKDCDGDTICFCNK